jgi:hypothetical protein
MSVASTKMTPEEENEQKAYEAMISLFYGKIFGIIPSYLVEKIEKTFKEINKDFDTECVESEGWNTVEEVYELASMLKPMSQKEREEFMINCPGKLLKEFIKNDLSRWVETPEQRAERIFKEDEEKQKNENNDNEKQELHERQLKRLAVFQKHEAVLKLSCDTGKQIRWRRHFYAYTKMLSTKIFTSEQEEYQYVGKPGRLQYTDHEYMHKAYGKNSPMNGIMGEIMTEFGCFEY